MAALRQPTQRRGGFGSQKGRPFSLSAPVGGLNARDSVAAMRATDAVEMENFFPTPTSVDVRAGFQDWSTFTGLCHTIIVYSGVSATKVFPCVKNGSTYSIYDGTSSGALSSAVVGGSGPTVQALTSARFDYVNFGTPGGHYLVAVNGADTPIRYDGTTWTASTLSGGTVTNYQSIGVYAQRLWVFDKNSFTVRYTPVQTVGGATTSLDLGSYFKLGGSLSSIITVTDDAQGATDYIAFMSTEGEIVAYTGTDPSSASDWQQSAHFRIGRPMVLGNRCWVKLGTDALVLCTDGVYPLRSALQNNDRNQSASVSDKIRPLLNQDMVTFGSKTGWGMVYHPTGAKLLVNVPTRNDVKSHQYVMNTQSRAWTKFTGWNALCFDVAQDTLYMGMDGAMVKADTATDDGDADITSFVRQAFNYLSLPGLAKDVTMLQPVIAADGGFQIGIGIDTDYRQQTLSSMRQVSGGSGDPWGGVWDVEWSGGLAMQDNWYGVEGVGQAIAVKLKTVTNGVQLKWSATNGVAVTGGVLA